MYFTCHDIESAGEDVGVYTNNAFKDELLMLILSNVKMTKNKLERLWKEAVVA
jgi:hypothetical protein